MERFKKIKNIDIAIEITLIENSLRIRRILIDLIQKVIIIKEKENNLNAIYRKDQKRRINHWFKGAYVGFVSNLRAQKSNTSSKIYVLKSN